MRIKSKGVSEEKRVSIHQMGQLEQRPCGGHMPGISKEKQGAE